MDYNISEEIRLLDIDKEMLKKIYIYKKRNIIYGDIIRGDF